MKLLSFDRRKLSSNMFVIKAVGRSMEPETQMVSSVFLKPIQPDRFQEGSFFSSVGMRIIQRLVHPIQLKSMLAIKGGTGTLGLNCNL
jgi:hypothetical protein